jgi:hypothetical protein
MIDPFSFEHAFRFTEHLYVALNTTLKRENRPVRLLTVATVGIACLFWSYTLLLGVALLLLMGMAVFLPSLIPGTAANTFRKTAYLKDEMTYGVNEKGLWVKGPRLSAEFNWENVVVWDERAGWLKISASQTPSVWFPIDKLHEAGVYDNVMKLCKKYAVKFNSREAKNMSNQRVHRIADKPGSR